MIEKIYGHRTLDRAPVDGELKVRVQVFEDLEELSRNAASLFLELAVKENDAKGFFTVLLSGGRTPKRLYELLKEKEFSVELPWVNTHLFWGDERCVNLTHPDSNYRMVSESLLSGVDIPPENVHPISGELKEGAAFLYEDEVMSFFKARQRGYFNVPTFDLVLMGLGGDGHILSLFPNATALGVSSTILMNVSVEEALVPHRVTMTMPVVNKASKIVFLVSGEEKSEILKETLEGDYDPRRYPAHGLSPAKGEIIYLVDEAAAKLLRQE